MDLPSAQRSGISATVGLVLVVGLLLVAGTLAVSGGGILNSGGRLGADAIASASPAPLAVDPGNDSDPPLPLPSPATDSGPSATVTNSFDYTCAPDPGVIRDANKGKWQITRFVVGDREDFDRVTWEMSRTPGSVKKGTRVRMEWMETKQARDQFGLARLPGGRAIVITFDGPVRLTVDQVADARSLEPEGVQGVRSVQMFRGKDGKVRTVIGVRGEGCARMKAPLWKKKSKTERSKIFLEIEKP